MRKDFEKAYVTAHDHVAVLTMNDPKVMNAAWVDMVSGLSAALEFIQDPANNFRAVVLTGEDRAFCSGANLGGDMTDAALDVGAVLEQHFHPFLRKLRNLPMPLVTAVNGAAAGVGMSFALMGDIVMAARSSYFLQAFARIGLVPDGGSTWLLPRLIGLARAKELSLLADKLPAETALEWGLINRLCDDESLMEDALAMAKRLADGPTASLALIRKLYWDSPNNSYEQQIDAERWAQRAAGRTADFQEGVTAFQERRSAKFQGK